MPHYHAEEATRAIKPILGDYYTFDSREVRPITAHLCSSLVQEACFISFLASPAQAPDLLQSPCYTFPILCLLQFCHKSDHKSLPHRQPNVAAFIWRRCTRHCGRTGSTRVSCRRRSRAAVCTGMRRSTEGDPLRFNCRQLSHSKGTCQRNGSNGNTYWLGNLVSFERLGPECEQSVLRGMRLVRSAIAIRQLWLEV